MLFAKLGLLMTVVLTATLIDSSRGRRNECAVGA
jgi:hypothetical protein